ncbi:MAG: hypothetical protein LBD11_00375 [Candidatus Peribacteria bacterium]|jgi:hypothetical protein|nr:hypothetical protein [Candidatus Peribacteria bacterium]
MNTQTHFSGSFGTESITFDQGEEKLVSKNSPSLQKEQTTKGTTDDITQVFTNAGEQEKILTMDEY